MGQAMETMNNVCYAAIQNYNYEENQVEDGITSKNGTQSPLLSCLCSAITFVASFMGLCIPCVSLIK